MRCSHFWERFIVVHVTFHCSLNYIIILNTTTFITGMYGLFNSSFQQNVHRLCSLFSFNGSQQCLLTFKTIIEFSWSEQNLSVVPSSTYSGVDDICVLPISYLCMDDKFCHTASQRLAIFTFLIFCYWYGYYLRAQYSDIHGILASRI